MANLARISLMLTGGLALPPAGLLIFFAVLFAYSLFTGIRALRRGWRSRFILRVVVPLSLLMLSSIGAGVWRLLLRGKG